VPQVLSWQISAEQHSKVLAHGEPCGWQEGAVQLAAEHVLTAVDPQHSADMAHVSAGAAHAVPGAGAQDPVWQVSDGQHSVVLAHAPPCSWHEVAVQNAAEHVLTAVDPQHSAAMAHLSDGAAHAVPGAGAQDPVWQVSDGQHSVSLAHAPPCSWHEVAVQNAAEHVLTAVDPQHSAAMVHLSDGAAHAVPGAGAHSPAWQVSDGQHSRSLAHSAPCNWQEVAVHVLTHVATPAVPQHSVASEHGSSGAWQTGVTTVPEELTSTLDESAGVNEDAPLLETPEDPTEPDQEEELDSRDEQVPSLVVDDKALDVDEVLPEAEPLRLEWSNEEDRAENDETSLDEGVSLPEAVPPSGRASGRASGRPSTHSPSWQD
jgi:hypothetical protein